MIGGQKGGGTSVGLANRARTKVDMVISPTYSRTKSLETIEEIPSDLVDGWCRAILFRDFRRYAVYRVHELNIVSPCGHKGSVGGDSFE